MEEKNKQNKLGRAKTKDYTATPHKLKRLFQPKVPSSEPHRPKPYSASHEFILAHLQPKKAC